MFRQLVLLLTFALASASITPCYDIPLNSCNSLGSAQCEILKIHVLGKTFDYKCQEVDFCGFYLGTKKQRKAQCLSKKVLHME